MKQNDVKVGGTYTMKIGANTFAVRITDEKWKGDKLDGWVGVNLTTNRSVRIKTAAASRARHRYPRRNARRGHGVSPGERDPRRPHLGRGPADAHHGQARGEEEERQEARERDHGGRGQHQDHEQPSAKEEANTANVQDATGKKARRRSPRRSRSRRRSAP